MATALGVTTGSFYWHFKNRQELLDALLKDWQHTNTAAMVDTVANYTGDPQRQLAELVRVWVDERDFDPGYDAAIRDWARVSAKTDIAVRRVDATRIDLLHGIFRDLGDKEPDALIRARITYFHQVGYYALGIKESQRQRLALLPTYLKILLGRQS